MSPTPVELTMPYAKPLFEDEESRELPQNLKELFSKLTPLSVTPTI